MSSRPPWPAFRAELEARGFRPSRRLGQNFLLDENMVRAIVRDAGVGAGDSVLEIGAGCGFLTQHLVETGAEVVAVEIDPRLLEIARDLAGARAAPGRLRFVQADALAGKHELAPEVEAVLPSDGRWHLVSNLPYSIGGPLLAVLAGHERAPESMTVLVQREVARRIAAKAGSADWGPLSIRLQARYAASILRTVPANLFWPRPKVESAVVRLERLHPGPAARDLALLDRWVGPLFARRRQTLGRVMAGLCGDRERALRALEEAGLEPSARAETLPLPTLLDLARAAEAASEDRPGGAAGRPWRGP